MPSAIHQDGGVKYATGALTKVGGRDDITTGTWSTMTSGAVRKLKELSHKIDRYRWDILLLCEIRWKNLDETTTEVGHKVFFSEKMIDIGMVLDFLFARTS